MAKKRKRERRDRLIVLGELQSRLIKHVTLLPIVALIGAATSITVFCMRLISEAAEVEAVLPSLTPLLVTSLAFAATMSAIIFYQAVRFSNRLAGPVYRIMRELEQIRAGNFNRVIRVRKDDFLDNLAEDLTRTSRWLSENTELRPDAQLEPLPDGAVPAATDQGNNGSEPSVDDVPAPGGSAAAGAARAEESLTSGASGSERGAMLIEFVVGILITATLLAATIPVCMQHGRLRRLDGEINLALAACRSKLEDIRAMPFTDIPTLNGVGFDVPSSNGGPLGLRPVPGDPDGLPGALTVIVDRKVSGETLYDVIAEVRWTGVLGRRQFRLSSLYSERRFR